MSTEVACRNDATDRMRQLPAIDKLITCSALAPHAQRHGRSVVVQALREVTAEARAEIASGRMPHVGEFSLVSQAVRKLEQWTRPSPQRVFNLTGTVLHTNLGRSPWPVEALDAVAQAAGASDLEFDLSSGKRGERDGNVEAWLRRLTGAEAAVVVNNNAAAVLIVLNTFARRKEVAVSRGELVEIGGSFRMPEIMARAGAELREIGTTNRTHVADYEGSIGSKTALLMKVSTSNYEIEGFTATVNDKDVASVAHRHGRLMYVDLGSGALLDLRQFGLPYEPTPQDALRDGADLVSVSGDKLLGGPQAGIILGRKELIAKIRRNPLLRALRVDKTRLAALSSVLRLYANPATVRERVPALRLLSRPVETIRATAEAMQPALARFFETAGVDVETVHCESQVGSGAHPLARLPSAGLRLSPRRTGSGVNAIAVARQLRMLPTPVVGRIEKDCVVLDMRCLESSDCHTFAEQFANDSTLEEKRFR